MKGYQTTSINTFHARGTRRVESSLQLLAYADDTKGILIKYLLNSKQGTPASENGKLNLFNLTKCPRRVLGYSLEDDGVLTALFEVSSVPMFLF